jgi:EmrB/QacA subfamily drug resistance transporter
MSSITRTTADHLHHATTRDRHRVVLFTMCLGVFIAQLDSTVVYLGVKHIGDDLGSSVSELQWVLDVYNLFYASLLLTGGTLGDLYGRTRIFVCGVALVAVGSIVCALAPNSATLIAGRAVTGIGAALELPSSLAILTVTYKGAAERGRAIGIWASCNGLAIAIGPTLGGLLVDTAGWRSIFYVVIPVCALGMAMALRSVPESSNPQGRHLDPAGQILAIIALAALSFVVIEGPHWGWTSPVILGLAAVTVVTTALFIAVEARTPGAMVPLDIFGSRPFNASLAIAGLMTFGMYAMLFLTPLYLQSVRGLSGLVAGLLLVPMSLVFVVVSQYSGPLMKHIGARAMMATGMGLMGGGLLLLTPISPTTNLVAIELALVVIGVGLGMNTGPVNAVAVANVPAERSGTASGLVNTARMVGATLGIAVLGAIFAVHAGAGTTDGMISGLRWAFFGGAIGELTGAVIALAFTRADSMDQARKA